MQILESSFKKIIIKYIKYVVYVNNTGLSSKNFKFQKPDTEPTSQKLAKMGHFWLVSSASGV